MGNLKENERIVEIDCILNSGQSFHDLGVVEVNDDGEFNAEEVIEKIKGNSNYFLDTGESLMVYDTNHIESIEITGPFAEEEAQKRFEERNLEKERTENERKENLQEIEKLKQKYKEI